MTTVQVNSEYIIINLERIEEDVFSNADKQRIVFLMKYLAGFNINYSSRTITFYFTPQNMNDFVVDFDRGGIDSRVSLKNFEEAAKILGG
jgi:hypothetical protein